MTKFIELNSILRGLSYRKNSNYVYYLNRKILYFKYMFNHINFTRAHKFKQALATIFVTLV